MTQPSFSSPTQSTQTNRGRHKKVARALFVCLFACVSVSVYVLYCGDIPYLYLHCRSIIWNPCSNGSLATGFPNYWSAVYVYIVRVNKCSTRFSRDQIIKTFQIEFICHIEIVWQWFPYKFMRINNICLIYSICINIDHWCVRQTIQRYEVNEETRMERMVCMPTIERM